MNAIPNRYDSPAVRLMRQMEADGQVTVSKFGQGWRIHGTGIDILIASLSWLHISDLRLPGRL